jgi:hypothetical protein
MPVGIFASGLILGWLWLRTESIWLAAIAHGALNNWGQYAFKYMKDTTAPDAVSAGFLALLAAGILLLGYGVQERRGMRRDLRFEALTGKRAWVNRSRPGCGPDCTVTCSLRMALTGFSGPLAVPQRRPGRIRAFPIY